MNCTARVLGELVKYCRLFSRQIGYPFSRKSIRITALTGTAATEIGGDTTDMEFQLKSEKSHPTCADMDNYSDMRLVIVDEVSFMDHDKGLKKLDDRLQKFVRREGCLFGDVPIAFLGDFRQLDAIGENGILKNPNSMCWEGALTNMVELDGKHRFRNCQTMSEIMTEMHSTGLSEKHRDLLNSRVIDGIKVKRPNIASTQFATFHNQNRCEQNSLVFREYLRVHHANCTERNIPDTAIIIRSKIRWAQNNRLLHPQHQKKIYEECSDADICDGNRKRADPFLTLFSGCKLMGTENKDVKNGVANGTTATFRRVKLKKGVKLEAIRYDGHWVWAVDIDNVQDIELEWADSLYKGTFRVKPQSKTFRCKFTIREDGKNVTLRPSIKFNHFPVILNHATTGHKLQGKTVKTLVVAEWSAVRNWIYVVLSRVTTLDGLYLTHKLPRDINFDPSAEYLRMMSHLRGKIKDGPEDVADLMANFDLPIPHP